MARTDIPSRWYGSVSFALSITSPRRLLLSEDSAAAGNLKATGQRAWDYVELDNRGNKGATIYYAFNGSLATATVASGVHDGYSGSYRLPPDSIDRLYVKATSISVLAQSNATTVYLNLARY